MIDKEPTIKKSMPAKRDATCLRVTTTITIPAGTLLRAKGNNQFSAAVGLDAEFLVTSKPGEEAPAGFRKVVAG